MIKELDQNRPYKYLGMYEIAKIQHIEMKEKIKKEYYRRVRLTLKTQLSAKIKIIGINMLAIPVVNFSFNINWKISELKNLDRKLLTTYRSHHPKDRQYTYPVLKEAAA